MADLRETSEQGRNWIEKFLNKIPGFKGYLGKENRRETDHIYRQYLVQRLGEAKQRVRDASRAATDAGKIMLLRNMDQANNTLEKVENRLKFAPHGYSGFFDAVKIREAELDQLYAFDVSLLTKIEEITTAAGSLAGQVLNDEAFSQQLSALIEKARALDSVVDQRDNIVSGLTNA